MGSGSIAVRSQSSRLTRLLEESRRAPRGNSERGNESLAEPPAVCRLPSQLDALVRHASHVVGGAGPRL